jgi:histidinol phosphatase-like PHP family hydrolase
MICIRTRLYSHGWIKPHGKGTIEENVQAAVAAGLKGIAISDHGPGHLFYGIKKSSLPEMRAEIDRLKPLYPQIDIYLSVEANILESENHLDVSPREFSKYDFVIAGYHYGVLHGHCMGNFMYGKGMSTRKARQTTSRPEHRDDGRGGVREQSEDPDPPWRQRTL